MTLTFSLKDIQRQECVSNRLLSVKSSSVVLFPQERQISGSICVRIHCYLFLLCVLYGIATQHGLNCKVGEQVGYFVRDKATQKRKVQVIVSLHPKSNSITTLVLRYGNSTKFRRGCF